MIVQFPGGESVPLEETSSYHLTVVHLSWTQMEGVVQPVMTMLLPCPLKEKKIRRRELEEDLHPVFQAFGRGAKKKGDICRRPILSGLFFNFYFLGLGPNCVKFRVWTSNLFRLRYLLSL